MKFFDPIFESGNLEIQDFFIIFAVALVVGVVFSFLCYFKSRSTKSFFITTALIPACVAIVIMLVNGNFGAGIAVAGAFSLVRFRSAQGTAKEIVSIFIAMAGGLAFGMGFLAYGAIFVVLCGLVLMLFSNIRIWEKNNNSVEKVLRITIPEDLDYTEVFDEIFNQYTKRIDLIKVKTTNLGSMIQLTYDVLLKNSKDEKKFIDDIRVKNGNLEVMIHRMASDVDL